MPPKTKTEKNKNIKKFCRDTPLQRSFYLWIPKWSRETFPKLDLRESEGHSFRVGTGDWEQNPDTPDPTDGRPTVRASFVWYYSVKRRQTINFVAQGRTKDARLTPQKTQSFFFLWVLISRRRVLLTRCVKPGVTVFSRIDKVDMSTESKPQPPYWDTPLKGVWTR